MAGKAPHISEMPITWRNWHQHLNWLNVFFVIIVPVLGFLGAMWTPLHPYTAIFAAVYYFNTALGITAGMWDRKIKVVWLKILTCVQAIIGSGLTHVTRQSRYFRST